MRKFLILFSITLMFSLFVANPTRAAPSFYAESFDVQLELQKGGSAVITETIEIHFGDIPFTFISREISAENTDGLTFLDTSMDGTRMSQGTQAGQVEVETGDPLKVTWHFLPTSDTSHIFVVRYRAEGVIRKGNADTLVWRLIPEDHDYSIVHSTITLAYPSEPPLIERPALNLGSDITWENDRIIFTMSGFKKDKGLLLIASFAPNSLAQAVPRWQIRQDMAASRTLQIGFVMWITTLMLGSVGLFKYIRANRCDRKINTVVPTATPPSEVPPAIVGKLMQRRHTYMGTIFDLAQHGILEVHEERGLRETKRHILVRKCNPTPLKPFEQSLLEIMFQPGEMQINMDEIVYRLTERSNPFNESLDKELIRRGWLDPERQQKQTMLFAVGLSALFLIMTLFIVAVFLGESWSQNADLTAIFAGIAGTGFGVGILALALLLYAGTLSVLTPVGEEQAALWRGFAEYLKQVSKGKKPAMSEDYFERYLAYAAVFDLGINWAKYFRQRGGMPLPTWFHVLTDSHADFCALVTIMSSLDAVGEAG